MRYLLILLGFCVCLNAHAWSVGDGADITTLLDRSQSLLNRTSGLKSRTENTLDEIREVSQSFRSGLAGISAEVSDTVRYGIEDVDQILALQREGLAEFLGIADTTPTANSPTQFDFTPPTDRALECLAGSPCAQFRSEVLGLFDDMSNLSDAMIATNGAASTQLSFKLDQVVDLIDRIPGRALFPLYKLFVSSQSTNLVADMHQQVGAALTSIEQMPAVTTTVDYLSIPDLTDDNFLQVQYDARQCPHLMDNYPLVARARSAMFILGGSLKILGKSLGAVGHTYIKMPKINGGFAEFLNAHVTLDNNNPKFIGELFDGTADLLLASSAATRQLIDACSNLRAQQAVLDNQVALLADIADLKAAQIVAEDAASSGSSAAAALALQIFMLYLLVVTLYKRYYRD